MNEKVGLLSYRMDRDMFEKPYSNETAQLIDNEVRVEVDVAARLCLVEESLAACKHMCACVLVSVCLHMSVCALVLGMLVCWQASTLI